MTNADITKILSKDDVKALRAGFDVAYMTDGARNAIINRLPRCRDLINADIELFYRPDYGDRDGEIGAPAREKVVLAALACSGNWDMAIIHMYWGLALKDGLSPAEVGEVILLSGTYSGVQVISVGLARVASTFTMLKAAVDAGLTSSEYIIQLLLGATIPEMLAQQAEKNAAKPPKADKKAAKAAKADKKAAKAAKAEPKPAKTAPST